VSIHLIDARETIPFDLKDERTILVDLSDLASIDGCKKEIARNVKGIFKRGFVYTSPIFRVLGVAAATEEEKEDFLETIVDKIESVASDVSSLETSVDMMDFDEIESRVKQTNKDTDDIKSDIRRILDKLSDHSKALTNIAEEAKQRRE